jgi:hypothetical protein
VLREMEGRSGGREGRRRRAEWTAQPFPGYLLSFRYSILRGAEEGKEVRKSSPLFGAGLPSPSPPPAISRDKQRN